MIAPPNNDRGIGAAACGYAPITRHPGGVHPGHIASPRLGGMDAVTPRQAPAMIPDHRFSIQGQAARHAADAARPAAAPPGVGVEPIASSVYGRAGDAAPAPLPRRPR